MHTSRFFAATRTLALVVAVAGLVACRASKDEIVAEHRPAVEATFARLAALHDTVRTASPLAADRIDAGAARVVLSGADSNALFVRAERLRAPAQGPLAANVPMLQLAAHQCGEVLGGSDYYLADGLPAMLSQCARSEYVFVQRTFVDEPARLSGGNTFDPGHYEGDVLLYRLADGALLGGFRIAADNSEHVSVIVDEHRGSDPLGAFNQDLATVLEKDITAKLKQHVPGSVPDDW
jgi:hypothetical protein